MVTVKECDRAGEVIRPPPQMRHQQLETVGETTQHRLQTLKRRSAIVPTKIDAAVALRLTQHGMTVPAHDRHQRGVIRFASEMVLVQERPVHRRERERIRLAAEHTHWLIA